MSDITKARYFLRQRGTGLDNLQSFGLMLSTAEQRYRKLRVQHTSQADQPGELEEREVEAALDYAVLRYLKKHNQLPKDAMLALRGDATLETKKILAQKWANS